MDTIGELLLVLVITAIGLCIGFAIFLYNHEKERKAEIRKANGNKSGSGQPDKPVHDESSRPSTAPAKATETPKTTRSI